MRNLLLSSLVCGLAAGMLLTASFASARSKVMTLAVYGDSPYGTTPTDTQQFDVTPAFIDSINADPDVGLVMHVGDIHSGKQYCTEGYDRSIYALWTRFSDPLVYTPGDNEWMDCHKKAEGGGAYNSTTGMIDYVVDSTGMLVDYAGGNPVENLGLVRRIFFDKPGRTLGGKKEVVSQRFLFDPRHPTDRNYVENVLWQDNKILFATANVPGGSNNDMDVWYGAPAETEAQARERSERTGATLRWLDTAFAAARLLRVKGVVLVLQADMWDPEKGAAHQAGFEELVAKIASDTLAYGGPVLMFNGDSHEFLSDNPLSASDPANAMHPGYDVANFHRIVVHGSTTPLEWLKVTIDPEASAAASASAFGPFSWQRVAP